MELSKAASVVQTVAAGVQALATIMYFIPRISAHGQPVGVGASVAEGGKELGDAGKSGATVTSFAAELLSALASHSGKMGSYFRRQADWTLQNNRPPVRSCRSTTKSRRRTSGSKLPNASSIPTKSKWRMRNSPRLHD